MRTCLADVAAPSVWKAARTVLERAGVEVAVPRRQTCCGQPGWSSGHPDEARRVARQALRAFAGDDPVVVPSGSCAAMVRHGYPELFAGTPQEDAAASMAERTVELTQFLAREGLHTGSEMSGTVTYHDSCHMLRILRERDSPRAALAGGDRARADRDGADRRLLRVRRHVQRQLPRGVGPARRGEGPRGGRDRGRRAGRLRPVVPAPHRRAGPPHRRPLRARHIAEVLAG